MNPTDCLTITRGPLPSPSWPWVLRMRWCDLLFAHYEVDPEALRRCLPRGLELDLFESRAYLGVVPFVMEDVSPRLVPGLPGFDTFPELNLRTYVKTGGIAGVWFFSLDASQKLAVRVARRLFYLPYFDARFRVGHDGDGINFECVRTQKGAPEILFVAHYGPTGPPVISRPGTLDFWLTERYCLYTAGPDGQLYRGVIEHECWPLQPARAEIGINSLATPLGIDLSGPPATLHFAKALDVRAWLLESV